MWSEKIQSVSLGRRYTVPHRLHTNDVVATESTRIEVTAVTGRWGRYSTFAGDSPKITVSPATWLSVWPVYFRIQADAYPRRAVARGVSVISPPVNVSSSAAVAKSAISDVRRCRQRDISVGAVGELEELPGHEFLKEVRAGFS